MRALIRRNGVKIEFSGRGQVWNEMLRPWLGGPEAPAEPAPEPAVGENGSRQSAALQNGQSARPQPREAPSRETPGAPPVRLMSHRGEASPRPAPAYQAPAVPAPGLPSLAPALASAGGAAAMRAPSPAPGHAPTHVPGAPSTPRTWYPPRQPGAQRPERPAAAFERPGAPPRTGAPPRPVSPPRTGAPSAGREDEEPEFQVERSSDPSVLFARLAALPGRRSERDAVLAAVWFHGKGTGEATGDDVERQFQSHRVFHDVKVVPHMLKHIHRTKMLETGTNPRAVRLTPKGVAYVRSRLVLD